jgi:hydrogenase maturation protease
VENVVLVDAVSSGAEAGTIFRFNLAQQALPDEFNLYSTHAFGVPQAVELARVLQKLPPRISFIGVEGECFEAGTELSPALCTAKDAVITEILDSLGAKGNIDA